MWLKVAKFKGAEYFRKALYIYIFLFEHYIINFILWYPNGIVRTTLMRFAYNKISCRDSVAY